MTNMPGGDSGEVAEYPFFTIVIPTYQRPRQLLRCLQACSALDYPQNRYEIIVVNDGGEEILPKLTDQLNNPPEITILNQPNAGPATARNEGVRAAKGDYIAFTDDDCMPDSGWLMTLASEFRKWPSAMIGGCTENRLPQNLFSTASHSLILALYAYYNRDVHAANFFTSNNLAVPTAQFWDIGGFDESFPMAAAEDRELCDRWRDQALPAVYAPGAVVQHAHVMTVAVFFAQHFRYGRGAWHFQQRRAMRSEETPLEPLSFYKGLMTHPFAEQLGWRKLPVAALICLSQVANAAGFFWEKYIGSGRVQSSQ
jgi:GT2 family glycosyltransferase